ncbi:Acyltransferase family protein [Mucisphaera calidilacus]|uniref:Acyltransferase family protein n=2 Tax=Mucisphaera calidilacus TaxID=2527982 RepID=A0A518BVJ9_9BACT|nr:Acyltransferase family protein [Mucisphaera calidilacus]
MTARRDDKVVALGLTSIQLDALKGVFILLIVLGHNTLFSSQIPGLFKALYAFHVHAFFILAFAFPTKPISLAFLRDRCTRYLIPYVCWTLLAAVIFFIIEKRMADPLGWFTHLLFGLSFGTAGMLNHACGFQLYWFLPALLTLTIFRAALKEQPQLKGAWILLCIAVLMFVGWGGQPLAKYQVGNILLVMAIWPIAVGTVDLMNATSTAPRWLIMLIGALALLIGQTAIFIDDQAVNIAHLALHTVNHPIGFIGQILCPAGAFMLIAGLLSYLRNPAILATFGRHSLLIYLSHSLIYQAYLRIVLKLQPELDRLLSASLTYLLVITSATALSMLITRFRFTRSLMTPRDWDDFRSAFAIRDQSS